jgi:hypothetical protein
MRVRCRPAQDLAGLQTSHFGVGVDAEADVDFVADKFVCMRLAGEMRRTDMDAGRDLSEYRTQSLQQMARDIFGDAQAKRPRRGRRIEAVD